MEKENLRNEGNRKKQKQKEKQKQKQIQKQKRPRYIKKSNRKMNAQHQNISSISKKQVIELLQNMKGMVGLFLSSQNEIIKNIPESVNMISKAKYGGKGKVDF